MKEDRPYQTLPEFQQAHEELLERFDAGADAGAEAPGSASDGGAMERGLLIAMIDPLRDFMRRAAAGGGYLYESRERRAAQGLLDYWASLCYGANLDLPRPLLAPHDPALLPKLQDGDCPYIGLEAFGERNAANFFGREERVQALLQRLAHEPLVVVTGASGSGKSSLVLAGLLPALRAGGLPGSASWAYPPALVPGSAPLASLAAALQPQATAADAEAWQVRLREAPGALPALLGEQPYVIVVDQFEEVMTLRSESNAAEFNGFVAALQALVEGAATPHRLVLTMRNDVDTQLAREYPALNRRYGSAAFPLVSMDSSQLREAIEGPALRVGLKFQDGVVDELIRSVVGEDAGLPLLQFSLMALWDRRHGNLITLDALRAVGSPRRAMTVAAERLYAELNPEQQLTTAKLFLALSRQGEGVTVFRNRVSRRRLHEMGEANLIDRVVQRFEQARLLRVTRRDEAADDLVEVAHEALLRNWELLQSLFSERRDERERRAFLRKQALKWREAGFDDTFLLGGLALRQAHEELDPAGMSEVERNYLAKSVQNEEALERQRADEGERRLHLAEQEARAAQRASRSKLALLAAVAMALLVLLTAAGLALMGSERAKRRAQDEAQKLINDGATTQLRLITEANERVRQAQFKADRITTAAQADAVAAAASAASAQAEQARATAQLQRSESARLMAEAESSLDNDAELAVFYASEAVRRDPRLMARGGGLVIDALRFRRAEQRLRPEPPGGNSVLALSPRGERLLLATEQQLSEWQLDANAQPLRSRSWPLAVGAVQQVAYAGEGGDVVIAGGDAVWLWRRDAELRALEPRLPAGRLTVSDDGRWLAAVGRDGRSLQVWRLADRTLRLTYKQAAGEPPLNSAMFDSNHALVVALVPSAALPRLQALRFEPVAEGFAPAPKTLLGGTCKSSTSVYAAGGMQMGVMTTAFLCLQGAATLAEAGNDDVEAMSQDTAVDDVLFSPHGRYVVKLQRATSEAIVEELSSGRTQRLQAAFDLSSKSSYENVISISDAGERLAIKGQDGSVRVYALGTSMRELAGRNGVVWVSDDDRWFITRGAVAQSKGYDIREVSGGRLVRQIPSALDMREFSVSRDRRWLQAQVRCDRRGPTQNAADAADAGSAGVQVWVVDLVQAESAPVKSPCVRAVLASGDGLHVLQGEGRQAIYSAAAQRVVWELAEPPAESASATPPGMRPAGIGIVLGEGGRFLARRVANGQASVEVRRVVGDTAPLERAWQFPAPRGWAVSLLGRGRALFVTPGTGAPAGELWDLSRADAPRLSVPGSRATLSASGNVLAAQPAPRAAWELRDIATGKSIGSLPGWMRIEPNGSFAYGANAGRWQVRRLDAPDRVLLEGEGQPDSWQFDRQGKSLALAFSDSDRMRVYRLSDGALRLEGRFRDLRTARLTGGGGYLLTDDGRLMPGDSTLLLESARAAVAARFGNEQRCELLMDEDACRQAKLRPRALSRASTSP